MVDLEEHERREVDDTNSLGPERDELEEMSFPFIKRAVSPSRLSITNIPNKHQELNSLLSFF